MHALPERIDSLARFTIEEIQAHARPERSLFGTSEKCCTFFFFTVAILPAELSPNVGESW
jgi:hypothetical protein